MSDKAATSVLGLTAQIVSAHVSRNQVTTDGLPLLIQNVYQSLATAGDLKTELVPQAPAVPIKKSVFPDFIVCLEDGRKLKMLKRHLRVSYKMTPNEYRAKWNLSNDYPMVAPSYTRFRSAMAKTIGLGRKRVAEPTVSRLPARRVRDLGK